MCTAIWSHVEVALNAAQTRRVQLDRLAFDQHGLESLDARRCSVGARFSITGCSRITSSRMSHTTGVSASTSRFAAFDGRGYALHLELCEDEGLEQFERHLLGQAALVQASAAGPPQSPSGPSNRRGLPSRF